jgi:uncharacterized membrane protein
MIEETFQEVANGVALALEAIVVLIIAAAAVKAIIRVVPLFWHDDLLAGARHDVWMRFATAIILALEFTLAADIIRSAVAAPITGPDGAVLSVRPDLQGCDGFFAAVLRRRRAGRV